MRARGAKALTLGADGPLAWAKARAAYEAALKLAAEPEPRGASLSQPPLPSE
jgi:hypothetical protein